MEFAPSMGVALATLVSKTVWVARLLTWGMAALGMAEEGQLWFMCSTTLVVELLLPLFLTQLKLFYILLKSYITFRLQMLEYPHWQQSRQHVDYDDLLWEEVLTIVESLAIWVTIAAVVLLKVRRSLEVRVLLLCLAIWVGSITGLAEPFMILAMEDQQGATNSTNSSRSSNTMGSNTMGSSSGSSGGPAATAEDDLHHWLLLHLHLLSVVAAALAAMAARRWWARGGMGSSNSNGQRGRARGAVGAGPRAGRRGLAIAAAGAHRAVLDPQDVDLAGAEVGEEQEQEQREDEGPGANGDGAESVREDQQAEGGSRAPGEEEVEVEEEDDQDEDEDEQPGALGRRPGVGRAAGPSRMGAWHPYMPMLRHSFTAVQVPGVWRPGDAADGSDAEAYGAGNGRSGGGGGGGRGRGLLRCIGAVVRRLVGGAPAVGYEARLRLLVELRTGQFLVAVHLHPGREELVLETVDAAVGGGVAAAYGGAPVGGLRGEAGPAPAGLAWGQGTAAAARHGGVVGSAEAGWTGSAGMGRGRRGPGGGAGGGAARGLAGPGMETQEAAALGGPLTGAEVVREVLLLRWWRPWAWVQWRLRLLLRVARRCAGLRRGRWTEASGAVPSVRVALANPRVLLVPPGGSGAVAAGGEHVVARVDVTCADPSMVRLRPGCELHARQDGVRLPGSCVQLRSHVAGNGIQQTVKLHFPQAGTSMQEGLVPGAEQTRLRPGLVLLNPQVETPGFGRTSTAREASYGGAGLLRQADQLGRLRRGVLLCVEDPGAAAELEEVLGPALGRRGTAGAGSGTGWAAVAARGLRVDLGVFVGQVRRLRDTVALVVEAEGQAGAAGWEKSSWWLAELLAGRAGSGPGAAPGGGEGRGVGSRERQEGLAPCLACSVAHACELEPLPPHNLEVLGEHLLYCTAAAGLHRTAQYVARLMCDVQRALVLAGAHRSCCAAAAAAAATATAGGSGKDGAECERGRRGRGGGTWLQRKVAAWKAQVEAHAGDTRCMRLHLHGFLGGGWVEALAAMLESHAYAGAVVAASAAAAAAAAGEGADAGEHEEAAASTAAAVQHPAVRSSRRAVGSRLGRVGGERRSGVVQYRLQVVLPRMDPRVWWAAVGLVVGHVLTWLAGWVVRVQPNRAAWSHWAALQVARWAPVAAGACTEALAVAVMLAMARWAVPLREAGGGWAGEGRGKRKGRRLKGTGQGQGQGGGGGVASGVNWVGYAARVLDAGVGAVATCGVLVLERLWAGAAVGEVGVGRWVHAALRGALFGCLHDE